jgi:chromosomal replication initiation ATPase DnaA
MDRLTEHTFFQPSALFGKKLQSDSDERINALERALRDVAALPHYVSPVVALAHHALSAFERVHTSGRLATISSYVACNLGVSHEVLMSRARDQRIAFCRQVAVYICRSTSGASFPALAAHFHRNHSTIHHAFKLIDKRVRADVAFRQQIEKLQRDLSHIKGSTAAAALGGRSLTTRGFDEATGHDLLA